MFTIRFADVVVEHLDRLRAVDRATVLDSIEPLRPNPLAPWELRVGSLRVFYEVVPTEPGVVWVLAVGKKVRNVLRVGKREVKL